MGGWVGGWPRGFNGKKVFCVLGMKMNVDKT